MTTNHRSSVLAKGHAFAYTARAENRDLTPAEQSEVEALIEQVRDLDAGAKSLVPGTNETALEALSRIFRIPDGMPASTRLGGGVLTPEAKAGIVQAFKTRTAFRTDWT